MGVMFALIREVQGSIPDGPLCGLPIFFGLLLKYMSITVLVLLTLFLSPVPSSPDCITELYERTRSPSPAPPSGAVDSHASLSCLVDSHASPSCTVEG
jgi:hypothetical protein